MSRLKSYSTRYLLSLLDFCRKNGPQRFFPTGNLLTFEELKKELKTRPHVPNKQESKAARKQRKRLGS